MSVIMEISIDHGIIKRIVFETMEQAQAELDNLKDKLGKDVYGRNYTREDSTHIINSPCGETVIVCHKVSSAGLADPVKTAEITKDLDDIDIARRKKQKEEELEYKRGSPPTAHAEELENK